MSMRRAVTIISLTLLVVACQKFSPAQPRTQISQHGDDESHYSGDNCMNCHYSAGNGEGFFTLAGTLYGNTNQALVELYEDMTGSPIMVIEVDQLGNAFTTDAIDYGVDGLFVAVRDGNGDVEFMDDPIFHGQCNLCHGTTIEERIEI